MQLATCSGTLATPFMAEGGARNGGWVSVAHPVDAAAGAASSIATSLTRDNECHNKRRTLCPTGI
jgi:hypothetical protein